MAEIDPEEETHTLSSYELLHLAENHLRVRNYAFSSQYALESLHSTADANALRHRAQQIIAVSDILSAASKTLESPIPNWYSILGLDTFCSDYDLIRSKFKSLLLLLGPLKSTLPQADEALKFVWKAWGVLGNTDKKSELDAQLEAGIPRESADASESFWTVCPYCYFMYEYSRVFEGYCLRCQNATCRRVFQGNSTRSSPPQGSNQEEFFCCMGYFPLGCSLEDAKNGKKFAPWSPYVGMFGLPDKKKTTNRKDDQTGFVEDTEAPVHEIQRVGSHVGTGSNVMNSYTVSANGKMLMQGGTVNLNQMSNECVDGVDNFGQFEGDYGFGSQGCSRAGNDEFQSEVDMLFVEKDGEIFLEMSPGAED